MDHNLASWAEQSDTRLNFMLVNTPPDDTTTIRVEKREATRWLLINKSVVKGCCVRYLQIKDLGLGVCEVMLRPAGKINTFVVKCFE